MTSPGVKRILGAARSSRTVWLRSDGNGPTSSKIRPSAGCEHPKEATITRHISPALNPETKLVPRWLSYSWVHDTGWHPVPADAEGPWAQDPGLWGGSAAAQVQGRRPGEA